MVFDWDRTVTKTEGFIHGKTDGFASLQATLGIPELTVKDVLEYHCGGLRRLLGIMQLFDLL